MQKLPETALSTPLEEYLTKQGYAVNNEVLSCDMVAVKGDEIIAIELKTSINLTLILQAVERQKFADTVYIATFRPKSFAKLKNYRSLCHLLKRLEIGLIFVGFHSKGSTIEIVFHPDKEVKRKDPNKKKKIIREIDNRSQNFNTAGSTRKQLITAYRENAVLVAYTLSKSGPLSAKKLKELGTGEKTYSILHRNLYGWFEKVSTGIYQLHPNGQEALAGYPELLKIFDERAEK